MTTPAIEARGLVKEFEKGRRFEWIALVVFAIGALWIGRRVFARAEHRMRVRGTLGQH